MASLCVPSTFTNPDLFGAHILSIKANLVTNFSQTVPALYWYNHPTTTVTDVTFCNVTVSYTHPGEGDYINVEVWLPVDTWNERVQAGGGGGWVAGGSNFILSFLEMAGAVGTGYATYTTDAGLGGSTDATPWALLSPGNVNLYNLQNLASVSLHDEAIIGKSIIKDFYGRPPKYSYFSGCSQGGRQGLLLAQRYPKLYDGIAASAPAINWNAFFVTIFWPQLVMNIARQYPHPCELDEITTAAVAACDHLDGINDGLVTNVKACNFDPFRLVGTTFSCSMTGTDMQISQIAAAVTSAFWTGPRSVNGSFLWYGPNIGSSLTGSTTVGNQAPVVTTCSDDGKCIGVPDTLGTQWISYFVEKDPDFNFANMTHEQFDDIFRSGFEFSSIIDTTDPDLSEFKAAGGKILGFHGLVRSFLPCHMFKADIFQADELIPTRGTEHYYDQVTELDPNVHEFYRFFEAPGIQHCSGGNGGQPTTVFDALVAWVENGTAPNTLPVSFVSANGTIFNQILCPYPETAFYDGVGSPTDASSYRCI